MASLERTLKAKDVQIYERLKQGDESRLREFYIAHEPMFVNTVAQKGWGTREDAKRIYPECVTILYYNIKDGKLALPLKSSLTTYLIAISRNVLSNERRSEYNQKTTHIDPMEQYSELIDGVSYLDFSEQSKLMTILLEALGEKCRNLIEMFYIKEYSAESVANELGIEKVSTVRKRKFDCLKKLKLIFKEHKSIIDKYQ